MKERIKWHGNGEKRKTDNRINGKNIEKHKDKINKYLLPIGCIHSRNSSETKERNIEGENKEERERMREDDEIDEARK